MKQLLRLLLSTVFWAVCLSTATAQTTQPASTGTSAFFTTSDGIKIHYLTLGDKGSWVVLLHGFGDTAERSPRDIVAEGSRRTIVIMCASHANDSHRRPHRGSIDGNCVWEWPTHGSERVLARDGARIDV